MADPVPEKRDDGTKKKEAEEQEEQDHPKRPAIPPSPRKVGESPDTLRRREEWFRKRQGS